MRRIIWGLALFLTMGLPALGLTPVPAAAVATCACLDNNDDDVCGGGVAPFDTILDSTDWLLGPTAVSLGGFVPAGTFPGSNFLIPVGCSVTTSLAPKGGVVVNAGRVTIHGSYISTPTGGEGTQFNATGEVLINLVASGDPRPHVESGGINKLVNNLANAGVAKSSVALKAGGTCTILNADLRGNPIAGSGQVGMQCNGTIGIHGSTVTAAGIDIQSLTGAINAVATSGVLPPVGIECDVPVAQGGLNQTAGNNNGILDAGDFPCTITFQGPGGFVAACQADPAVQPNIFRALNNPLEMIAQTNLRLDSPLYPGNIVEGRFLVNLVAGTGNVDLDNAVVTNCDGCSPLGGAKIFVAAGPTTFTRFAVLKETWTATPAIGNIGIDGTCFKSFSDVFYGNGDVLVGTPNPLCKVLPADFTAVVSGP